MQRDAVPSIQSFDKFSFMVLPFVATVYYSGCWASSRAAHQPFHHSLVWSQIMYIHGLAAGTRTLLQESRKMVAKQASLYHHKEQENIRRDSRSSSQIVFQRDLFRRIVQFVKRNLVNCIITSSSKGSCLLIQVIIT